MRAAIPLTLGALFLGGAGLYQATDRLHAFTAEGARRYDVSRTRPRVPDFVVEDMAGTAQPLRPQNDEIVLVEFIYTACPTICQTSGGEFAELRDALAKVNVKTRMLSVSFDTEVDDLSSLQTYAQAHSATGDPWTVARLSNADLDRVLDFFQVTVIPDGWGGYQHNTAVLLIDNRGRLSGVFDTDAIDQIVSAAVQLS